MPTFKQPLSKHSLFAPLRNNHTTLIPSLSATALAPDLSFMAEKCKSMAQLKQIHAQMIISSQIRDNLVSSRLLSFCAVSNSGDLNYALKILSYITKPNVFMYNTIIRAHASSLNPCKALIFYVNMRRFCLKPGKHTFPFLLKACLGLRSIKCCGQVHNHAVKFGFDLDLHVVNGLVRCYSVLGSLSDARKVFDEISVRNLSVWTTLICGYAQNSCASEALVLFDRMIEDGFEPKDVTLSSVLSACARTGSLDLGEKIHNFMKEKGIDVGVILGSALVHMYAKNGAIGVATDLFDSMREKNVVTWNAMICGLAVHGHANKALDLFRKMGKEEDVKPNDITFVGVLSACCHAGLLDVGRGIFRSMKTVYSIDVKIQHYGCMADLLGRCGELLEAEELIKGMIWKPDVVIWGALLSACYNHGNIEIAERVVKEILVLEPNNHGVYVVLSNMYAEAGRWEDVAKLRMVLKDGKLKKTRGWSSVDSEN